MLIANRIRKIETEEGHAINWRGTRRALGTWLAFAASVALMEPLGFVLSFGLLTFIIVVFILGRPPITAGLTAIVVALAFHLTFPGDLERLASDRLSRVLRWTSPAACCMALRSPCSRRTCSGASSVAARHGGRHPAGARPARDHRDAAAAHVPDGSRRRDDHAGRHLLRRQVRRLDHLDPAERSRRIGLGGHLHRRLRDGAQGPRRRGARHRGDRFVHRRHGRRASA